MSTHIRLIEETASIPPVMLMPGVIMGGMVLAYLIGSIPFGLILSKLYKTQDLRTVGSGNIGATNMLRAGGKKLAAATLFLDMIKGYIAVALCGAIADAVTAGNTGSTQAISFDSRTFYYMFGVYAVAGHIWPVWLKFKGGKGVATALGVLFAFSLPAGMLAASCWLAVFALSRISSLSALAAIGLSPVVCYFMVGSGAAIAALLIALAVFWRHKDNITRLLNGTEPKISLKKPS